MPSSQRVIHDWLSAWRRVRYAASADCRDLPLSTVETYLGVSGASVQRVVPVEEMAAMPLERLHCAHRIRRALDELPGRFDSRSRAPSNRPAGQSHVGRRRAMRNDDAAFLLHIVGRQPVFVGVDVRLENPHVLRGKSRRNLCDRRRQFVAARSERLADPPRERRATSHSNRIGASGNAAPRRSSPAARSMSARRSPARSTSFDRPRPDRCCGFHRADVRRCSMVSIEQPPVRNQHAP